MSFFPGDLFWSVNFTYASIYLWKVFFQRFLWAKFWSRHLSSSVSILLTPFCRCAVSKCQHLHPKAIQECSDERAPLYNLASHLPLPTSIQWGKYLLSCVTPRVWIGTLGLQHQTEKWEAVREVRCLWQILKSVLPEKAYMVVAYTEGKTARIRFLCVIYVIK